MKPLKSAMLLLAGLLVTAGAVCAEDDTNQTQAELPLGFTNQLSPKALEILNLVRNLKYQRGEIDLRGGLARLNVPPEFRYLGPDDAETVLVKLWGNPPSEGKTLGLLLPTGVTPLSSNCWVVTIEYSEDGYVKDSDASKINYDDLLKQMQKGVAEENVEREKAGYPTATLVGWAAPPHYDQATHKLYWAKDFQFTDSHHDTLNYNIRMLGRRGVLELTAVAGMNRFAEIDRQTPQILAMVDFKDGNRYADFDPKMDKVAKYGLAALVAGGVLVAAKAGLFKVLLMGLVAGWKFVLIGLVAIGSFIKKLFGRRNNSSGS